MGDKILVIGCGGLGSELLKLLVFTKFEKLIVVDNDSIDLTNLNRQFLYTKKDINKSKGIIAATKISRSCEINGIHADIKTFKDINWYKQFDVVYNCLDNNDARLFVNQRCIVAGVKMIDGGSEGWLGQSFNNGVECFDCLPKKSKEIYPVCNIRQQAETFEHCLVWANVVYKENNVAEVKKELEIYWKLKNGNKFTRNKASLENKRVKDNIDGDSVDKSKWSLENNKEKHVITGKRRYFKIKRLNKQFITKEFVEIMKIKRNIQKLKQIKNKIKIKIKIKDFESAVKNAFLKNNDMTVYKLACLKADIFKIKPYSFLRAQTFFKNIVPSICTTNSIIASLMILSSRNNKNYYLVQNNSIFISVDLNDKRKDCLSCGIPIFICRFNSQATVSELLEEFSGSEMIFGNKLYDFKNSYILGDLLLDKEFGIIIAKDKKFNFYFEKCEMNEKIKIVKL